MHGRGGANAVQRGHDLGDHGFGNRTVRFDGAPRVRAAAAPDGGGDHPGRQNPGGLSPDMCVI